MIDHTRFRLSLLRLREQYENYCSPDPSNPQIMQEAVAESVIHRFEVCYDTLWKTLKRYLMEALGIPQVPNSPKPVFRLAYENGIFDRTSDNWMKYAQGRIDTAHDYDHSKATKVLELIEEFIDDSIILYETISGEQWDKQQTLT